MRTLKEIRETYKSSGIKSLSDADLLSCLGIKSTSPSLIPLFTSNKEMLISSGYSPAEAERITSISELLTRFNSYSVKPLTQIKSSSSAAKLIMPLLRTLPHEEFWVMYLNRANRLISQEKISSGGISATVVDAKLIVKRALEHTASSIIMVHNHPSGNNNPGENDRTQTKLMKDAAGLFDISLLDHLIIAGDSYYSFADEGTL